MTLAPGKVGSSPIDPRTTPWLKPPPDAIELNQYGSVALPAVAATATVLQFVVPNGRNGIIRAIGVDFTANGASGTGLFTPNVVPAELTFSLKSDQIGSQFPGYDSFAYLPGSVIEPTYLAFGLLIKSGQTIVLTVTNVSVVVATQFVAGRVLGWLYPQKREPRDLGYQ